MVFLDGDPSRTGLFLAPGLLVINTLSSIGSNTTVSQNEAAILVLVFSIASAMAIALALLALGEAD
jgi:hypothetical protein